jgi:AcrR family transcriptional regulator
VDAPGLSIGAPAPSAARIAARAGVSLRSVFQHFNDVESLFAAAASRQAERLAAHRRRPGRRTAGAAAGRSFASARSSWKRSPPRRAAILPSRSRARFGGGWALSKLKADEAASSPEAAAGRPPRDAPPSALVAAASWST